VSHPTSSAAPQPDAYTYPRYLQAKETVDDRALNRRVWETFVDRLQRRAGSPCRILEIGAGTGATAKRVVDALRTTSVDSLRYTLVDIESDNLTAAREELLRWSRDEGFDVWGSESRVVLTGGDVDVSFSLIEADLFDFAEAYDDPPVDALIAQAVLDLFDVADALRHLEPLLDAEGLWYLPIHYDGVTAFEPTVDAALDGNIESLYNASMSDEEGGRSGSHCGRRLLSHLREQDMDLIDAGASDWVVLAGDDGTYRGDEAYFLHHILHFIEEELRGHPDLNEEALAHWLAERRRQIADGDLIYIAHQLDVLAKKQARV
jgi:SAM-dependent methyltransferase